MGSGICCPAQAKTGSRDGELEHVAEAEPDVLQRAQSSDRLARISNSERLVDKAVTSAICRSTGRRNSLRYVPGEQELCFRTHTTKTPAEKDLIKVSIRHNPNLRKFSQLKDEGIQALADAATREIIPKGNVLMSEGDLNNAVFLRCDQW